MLRTVLTVSLLVVGVACSDQASASDREFTDLARAKAQNASCGSFEEYSVQGASPLVFTCQIHSATARIEVYPDSESARRRLDRSDSKAKLIGSNVIVRCVASCGTGSHSLLNQF